MRNLKKDKANSDNYKPPIEMKDQNILSKMAHKLHLCIK